jgi:hypothetical protein
MSDKVPANRPGPRATLATALSLCVHLALVVFLLARAPASLRPPASSAIEVDIVSTVPLPPPPPPPPAATAREAVRAAPKRSAAPRQPIREQATAPRAAEPPEALREEPPAIAGSDLPRRGAEPFLTAPGGAALDRIVKGAGGIPVPEGVRSSPIPPTREEAKRREAGEVRQRVDAIVQDTQARHREDSLGCDTAVVELGGAFERAAISREVDGPGQAWIQKAFAEYFERLRQRQPRFTPPEPSPSRDDLWEARKAAARAALSTGAGTYVALVEVRQADDGRLADLRLLASSGAHEFDSRALGSIVQGLATTSSVPDGGGLGPGRLSLWELRGEKLPDSKIAQVATTVVRYALLDVVPLKETVIELQKGGGTERLKYTARLVTVY